MFYQFETLIFCEIWDSYDGDYEEFYYPGCDALWLQGRSLLTGVLEECTASIFRVEE
jgi:hypothetical protein